MYIPYPRGTPGDPRGALSVRGIVDAKCPERSFPDFFTAIFQYFAYFPVAKYFGIWYNTLDVNGGVCRKLPGNDFICFNQVQ